MRKPARRLLAARSVEQHQRVTMKFVVTRLPYNSVDDLQISVALEPTRDVLAELFPFLRLRRRKHLDASEHEELIPRGEFPLQGPPC